MLAVLGLGVLGTFAAVGGGIALGAGASSLIRDAIVSARETNASEIGKQKIQQLKDSNPYKEGTAEYENWNRWAETAGKTSGIVGSIADERRC